MTEPVRFAVVGCGAIAQAQHLPNLAASPKTGLYACCDVSEQTLAHCRDRFGPERVCDDYEQLMQDPAVEAVCVATTERLRLPVIRAAAEAGKAVYVEKPVANSAEELAEIRRVVDDAGIPFCVGHNRRAAPALAEAKRIFSGHLASPAPCPWRIERMGDDRPDLPEEGAPAMLVRINDDWHSWKAWALNPEHAPHGSLLFEMTHFTDLCNWFLGDEPEEVVTLSSGKLNHSVSIRYADGAMGSIVMAGNGTFGYPKELYEMFGAGGAVTVNHLVELRTAGIEGAPAHKTYPLLSDAYPEAGAEGGFSGWLAKQRAACEAVVREGGSLMERMPMPDKGHRRLLELLADEVRGGDRNPCGLASAALATRVALAAVESVRRGEPVQVRELAWEA